MPRTKDTEHFLKKLRELDGSAGNKALRDRLRWEDKKYFRVRKLLIEEGIVDVGRGKGGSVYVLEDDSESGESLSQAVHVPASEKDHYQQVLKLIERQLNQDFKDAVIQLTAHLGKRPTGGKWSRPDLLAVTVQRFEYVLHDEFLLRSYEIKRNDNVDIDAVAEAAAHQRLAQMAYIVIVPHSKDTKDVSIFNPTDIKRRNIEKECLKLGVGMILISDYHDDSEVELAVEANISGLDQKGVNSTIGRLFDAQKREEIRKLIRASRPA